MNEVKVILTIYMEGATLHRKSVKTKNSKGKRFKTTEVEPQEIKQSIKLTRAFYDNALHSAPIPSLIKVWNRIGKVNCRQLSFAQLAYMGAVSSLVIIRTRYSIFVPI